MADLVDEGASRDRVAGPTAPSMRRVAVASCVGTTIEFYDFFIYGTAAALVFPVVFFPALGGVAGTVASFATFAVAFVARPLGAVVFGHWGDRIGRKRTLIATLLLMGVATVLIGLLPGAATIGVAAPILLVVLRFAQGFAVGGEWAGATLLTAEYAPAGKRGHYAVYPQVGPAIAFALSSGTFLVTGLTLGDTDQAFLEYGWRVPFVASAVLVGVGLYVRLAISETPEFRRARATQDAGTGQDTAPRTLPFADVLRAQPREILLSGGMATFTFSFFYMGTAYLTNYGTSVLDLDRQTVLSLNIVAAVFFGITTLVGGRLSDRLGRRTVITAACAAGVVWALALFPVLDIGTPLAFGVGLTVLMMIFGVAFGPVGAFLPELFETRYRYTGAGVGYNLAGILGGAVAPLFAPVLATSYGGIAIGVLLAVISIGSLVCTRLLVETHRRNMADAGTGARC